MANATTLQHVTKRKLEKLADHINKFEGRKRAVLDKAETASNSTEQVEFLLHYAKKNNFDVDKSGTGAKNIKRFLAQAEHDPSVSAKQIQEWKDMIERDMEISGRRLKYASLFGKLCTEWIDHPNAGGSQFLPANDEMDVDSDAASMSSSFINVGRKEMQEQRETFEKYCFTECPKDQEAIDSYLKNLFESTQKSKKLASTPLHQLQLAMGKFDEMAPLRFNSDYVGDCIDGLLDADFFSGAKRQELIDMSKNDEILEELADVLNMDLDEIESWDWEKPIPLNQRRQLNGKYRVYHDEEIHQAIFLQFIGMKWAVFMKQNFVKFFHSGAWSQHPYRALDKLSKMRRQHFIGVSGATSRNSVRQKRRDLYQKEFFMLQLPNGMASRMEDYGDHDAGAVHKSGKKDLLHRLVTTEMLVQSAVYGECTVMQSDFKWFGPSIPHDTIFAVMKFLGVKGKWLEFFRKFLTAKCYWADESSERTPEIKQRKRGIPMSHVLSDAMGEAILFCMDFAVSKATKGADLYRFHDDLWFFGQEEVCVKAWKAIEEFTAMTGLELNMEKTGCVQVFDESTARRPLHPGLPSGDVTFGLLKLDGEKMAWIVDEQKVQDHVRELDRQLRACNSVFAWVQAWNSYACRFLSNNLALPAKCFGQQHVDMVLKVFSGIQRDLFGPGGSAHEHLRKMIAEPGRKLVDAAAEAEKIPDAFFYFPLSSGGLEMKNPFIQPLAVRDHVPKEVSKIIAQAFESDETDWEAAKKRYDENDGEISFSRPPGAKVYEPKEDEPFMPLEEFVRFREECSNHLGLAYGKMMEVPQMEDVDGSNEVKAAVDAVPDLKRWSSLSAYWRWLYELHGREVIEMFGGMAIGEAAMLPLGMVESLKSERTRWLG